MVTKMMMMVMMTIMMMMMTMMMMMMMMMMLSAAVFLHIRKHLNSWKAQYVMYPQARLREQYCLAL